MEENLSIVKTKKKLEQFENILEENDWYESEVQCHDPNLLDLLEENKLTVSATRT
jgi:hypothetical protein